MQALFNINANNGQLTFKAETTPSVGTDYVIEVSATDAAGNVTAFSQAITVGDTVAPIVSSVADIGP